MTSYRHYWIRMSSSYLDAAAWTEEERLDEENSDALGWGKEACADADKACTTFLLTELTDAHLRPDLWDKPLDEMPAQPGEQVHDLLERLEMGPEQAGHELGCSWHGLCEPKYEYPGTYRAYTPELGLFEAPCDAEANIMIYPSVLLSWIREAESLEALHEQVDRATGGPWCRPK